MALTHPTADKDHQKALVLAKAFFRASAFLELTRQEMRDLLGLSEATLSRLINQNKKISPTSKEGEIALFILRIFRSLDSFFGGNVDHVRQWFNAYNTYLKGIPRERIKTIGGLVHVADYLDAMRGKV